jgi:hypothetical protein
MTLTWYRQFKVNILHKHSFDMQLNYMGIFKANSLRKRPLYAIASTNMLTSILKVEGLLFF